MDEDDYMVQMTTNALLKAKAEGVGYIGNALIEAMRVIEQRHGDIGLPVSGYRDMLRTAVAEAQADILKKMK